MQFMEVLTMFKIIKEGTSLGMTEAPTYVRQAENGCFVLCREAQATGIAYGGRGERDPGGDGRWGGDRADGHDKRDRIYHHGGGREH